MRLNVVDHSLFFRLGQKVGGAFVCDDEFSGLRGGIMACVRMISDLRSMPVFRPCF